MIDIKIINETSNSSRHQVQRVMSKLTNGLDVNMLTITDSTSDGITEWNGLLAGKLASKYPSHTFRYYAWNESIGNYNPYVVLSTGTGSAVFNVWNGGRGGSNPNYFIGSMFENGVKQTNYDLCFISYGHNGGTELSAQENYMRQIVKKLIDNSTSPIIIIGQNPVLGVDTMYPKVLMYQNLAKNIGVGFINVHDFFVKNAIPLSSYLSDAIHPNSLGSELWADYVFRSFQSETHDFSGNDTEANTKILDQSSYDEINATWQKINGVTTSKSTTEYETRKSSIKIEGTGTATSGYLRNIVVNSTEISRYRGKIVTAFFRIKVVSGVSAGACSIYDGVTSTGNGAQFPVGEWIWSNVSMRISEVATQIQLSIFATKGTTTDSLFLDRVIIVEGSKNSDTENLANRISNGSITLDSFYLTEGSSRYKISMSGGALTATLVP